MIYFDSIYGVEYPEVSGVQGNGNQIHLMYEIISTPSIVVIRPDHVIAVKQIWPPSFTNVTDSVSEAGGIFQECLTATDIQRQKKHLVVAPNPVSDFAYFTFDLNEPETIEVTIRSITGKVVFHNKPTAFAAGKALIEANLSLQSQGNLRC